VKRQQPDWTPEMLPAWKDDPGLTKATEGTVSYDCDTSDGPRIVTVYVRTALNTNDGLWFVTPISIISTADRAELAHSVVQHMINTWEKNPQWVHYQNQVTQMGLDQIRKGFQQLMSQMQAYHHEQRTAAMNQQVARFEAHQSAQQQQVSSFGEALTGLQTVSDPMTGSQFQVFSGPKANYYVNGVKVNFNVSRGLGFHQLTPVQ